jgi:PAS domain S-box-containing protein
MEKPPILVHEKERLQELESYGLIGLDEHEDYDFITSMAAQICGTKISLISLITEDKQWFLSHRGLAIRETPRDVAFCAHAIVDPHQPLIVEDARKDERFFDNPLTVEDPNVVFYAGFPLVESNGYALGTLCAIDHEPKALTPEQISQLQKLARQTVKLFENRKYNLKLEELYLELEKKNQLLEATQTVNQMGTWELDIVTGATVWSDVVYSIYEVSEDFEHNKSIGLAFFHPESRPMIDVALHECIQSGTPFDLVSRLITAKGNHIWVRSTGRKLGEKLVGSFQDITTLKNDEIRYKSVLEGTNVGTWEWNVQTGELVCNARWGAIVGATFASAEICEASLWQSYTHPQDWVEASRRLQACFDKVTDFYEMECRMQHQDGYWVWVYCRGKVFEWTESGAPLMFYGTIQEITERKQKEEALRISEEAFRGNFENAGIGMALFDIKGNWLKVNQKVCTIIGYSEEELLALNYQTVTHPDDLDKDLMLLNELIRGKRSHYQLEKRYFHKNGHLIHVILAVSAVRDTEGSLLYFISQFIDITAAKQQQVALDYQRNLFTALFDLSPIGIALNDYETGAFLEVNQALLQSSGFSHEDFLASNNWIFGHSAYADQVRLALEQLQTQGEYTPFEKNITCSDGTTYPAILQGVLIQDEVHQRQLIWSFVRDVRHEKEAERQLHEAIDNLQAVLDGSRQVAIITTDIHGTITRFNSGAEFLLGYQADEVVGKASPKLIHLASEIESESQVLSAKYQRSISGFETFVYEASQGNPTTKEWTYIHKDGTTFPVLLSVNALRSEGKLVGYLAVATDVSALKAVEKEIKSLLDITNEQNERLRNFAHIVSHNLRSHSGGFSGILDLIDVEYPDIAANEFVQLIRRGADNLKQTVHDLTEIVKVNLTQIESSDISLYDLIQKNIESLGIPIQQAGIEIQNTVSPHLRVKGVQAYLDSIVLNMITNAIKYRSTERSSYLKISVNEDAIENVLTFEDNGLGIDMSRHGEKLFGMYKTFHKHADSRGVGLFITKNQVESMGGKIAVVSVINEGTTFSITLPK